MSSPSRLLKGRPTAPLPGTTSEVVVDVKRSHPRLLQSASPTPKPCRTFHREQLSVFLLKIAELALCNDPQETGFEIAETAIKELLNADRASLFLIDKQTKELHARIFSVSNEESDSVESVHLEPDSSALSHLDSFIANLGKKPVDVVSYKGNQISVSIDKGVIGYVARTGQLMNVKCAPKNEHFCKEIDKITGYKTKQLLCAPLVVDGEVIGVIEALNKKMGKFTQLDEQNIQSVALICSLYLSHLNLKKECRRQENKYKVANEMLQYQCTVQSPVQHIKNLELIPTALIQQYNIDSFFCDTKLIPDSVKANLFVKIVSDLVDNSLFHSQQLLKFSVAVSRIYRPTPYHNWDHAFHVTHFMCCILKDASGHFSDVEKLALVLSCLCHDLDHRAVSNGFLVSTNHPLAQLYSSSVMENHHLSQTIELLQLDGLDVLSLLTKSQYQEALEIMQKAILATDLMTFSGNKSELSKVLDAKCFSWETPLHKNLIICLMMTLCDLCSVYKPWDIHIKSVHDIVSEFYVQGDLEKSVGIKPVEMMDRKFKHKLPDFEVGFIQGIAEPCCQLLTTVMPHLNSLLQTTRSNKKMWQDVTNNKIKSPIDL